MRQGEELFRNGRYERALHVWTRVLFLDRGNVEARKAIERAKRTLAERQRQLDVEVLAASDLVERGSLAEAREKLRQVLEADPRHTEAQQLASQLDGLERRREPTSAAHDVHLSAESETSKRGLLLRVSQRRRRVEAPVPLDNVSPIKMAVFVLAATLAFATGALYLYLNWESILSDGAFGITGSLATPPSLEPDAPVPDVSELHYYNAERLVSKGRYREALQELGRVSRDAPVFERARSLTLRIEQRLLRGAAEPEPRETPEPPVPAR